MFHFIKAAKYRLYLIKNNVMKLICDIIEHGFHCEKCINPLVLSAGIAGGLNFLGGSSQAKQNYKNQRKLNSQLQEFTRENMATAQKYAEKNYSTQRADAVTDLFNKDYYDRMSRMKAGKSLAGDGVTPATLASAAAHLEGPSALGASGSPNIGVPNLGAVALDGALKAAQIRNVDAETEKTKTETESIETHTGIDRSKWSIEQKRLGDMLDAQIQQAKSAANQSDKDAELKEQLNSYYDSLKNQVEENIQSIKVDRFIAVMRNEREARKLEQDIKESAARIKKMQSDMGVNAATIALLAAQTTTEGYKQEDLRASANNKMADTQVKYASLNNMAADAKAKMSEKQLNDLKADAQRISNAFHMLGFGEGSGVLQQVLAIGYGNALDWFAALQGQFSKNPTPSDAKNFSPEGNYEGNVKFKSKK